MAVERRFSCTSCGKCCYGSLPLTLDDALLHAGRFPLALVWTPLPQQAKGYALATRLGLTVELGKRHKMAAVITPTAYLPATLPCPELTSEGLCGIHASKPQRCKTMPFYPYVDEADQARMIVKRDGWECDTSPDAPIVYRGNKIVDCGDFDRERMALLEQAPTMREYGAYMLKYSPGMVDNLKAVSSRPDGQVLTSLSSFFTAIRSIDSAAVAARQLPVLTHFAEATAGIAEFLTYHRSYTGWASEMEYICRRQR